MKKRFGAGIPFNQPGEFRVDMDNLGVHIKFGSINTELLIGAMKEYVANSGKGDKLEITVFPSDDGRILGFKVGDGEWVGQSGNDSEGEE